MNQVFTNFSKIGRILNLNLSKIDHIRKVGNTTQHEPDLNLRRTINIQLLTQVLRLDFGLMMYRFKSMHLSCSFTSRGQLFVYKSQLFVYFFQKFVEDECRCRCADVAEREECDKIPGKVWDTELCRCLCPPSTFAICKEDEVYDFRKECRYQLEPQFFHRALFCLLKSVLRVANFSADPRGKTKRATY